MNKRIIYQSIENVEMWCSGLGNYNAKLITYIIRYKFLFFNWYLIRQIVPKVFAWYDGEYASNRRAKTFARQERIRVKLELQYYKENGKWKNEI